MELEPITRQEKIIAGQDLTPITRMEMFLKNFGGGGGGGGGTDDVYTVKLIVNGETGERELQGDYAGALDAWQSGKSLEFVEAISFEGQEIVHYKSFSYAKETGNSFAFVCYSGNNFVKYKLTESGIAITDNCTHVSELYVDDAGGLLLRSSTEGSTKIFRVMVRDTGELSTEEINKPN